MAKPDKTAKTNKGKAVGKPAHAGKGKPDFAGKGAGGLKLNTAEMGTMSTALALAIATTLVASEVALFSALKVKVDAARARVASDSEADETE